MIFIHLNKGLVHLLLLFYCPATVCYVFLNFPMLAAPLYNLTKLLRYAFFIVQSQSYPISKKKIYFILLLYIFNFKDLDYSNKQ